MSQFARSRRRSRQSRSRETGRASKGDGGRVFELALELRHIALGRTGPFDKIVDGIANKTLKVIVQNPMRASTPTTACPRRASNGGASCHPNG
jgi:hypothetical protein